MKRKLTKQDLKKTLSELGFKEGDELILPSQKPKSNEQESNEGDEGQGGTTTTPPTGGPNPPPDKERP